MKHAIGEINEWNQQRFVQMLGEVFERSPWVAEQAWHARPFESVGQLHAAMLRVVKHSSDDSILGLLKAHPDLATRLEISEYSVGEQQGAGLDRLTAQEYEWFSRYNRAYKEKFGFPFIFAVAGKSKDEVIAEMKRRIANDASAERDSAMKEIGRITRIRLHRLIKHTK